MKIDDLSEREQRSRAVGRFCLCSMPFNGLLGTLFPSLCRPLQQFALHQRKTWWSTGRGEATRGSDDTKWLRAGGRRRCTAREVSLITVNGELIIHVTEVAQMKKGIN